MRQSLQTLKGVGEKTEKLFFKLGIYDTEDLIHYYPRNYDAFEAPVDIADLEEGTVKAVSAAVCSGVYVRSTGGKQIITATVADQSGKTSRHMVQHAILENNSQKRQYFRITWAGHQKTKPDSDGTSGSFYPGSIRRDPAQPAANLRPDKRTFQQNHYQNNPAAS